MPRTKKHKRGVSKKDIEVKEVFKEEPIKEDIINTPPEIIKELNNENKSSNKGYVPVIILIILVLFAIFIPKREVVSGIDYSGSDKLYELTEFAAIDEKIAANLVTIKGVKLGDIPTTVKEKLGNPDFQQAFDPNILNFEYSSTIDTLGSGILLHFEGGILTRITIAEPFNKYLKDKIKIGSTTEDLYKHLGKPTKIEHIQESKDSPKAYKKIIFGDLGYEFIIDKDVIKYYSFVLPDKIKNKGAVTI